MKQNKTIKTLFLILAMSPYLLSGATTDDKGRLWSWMLNNIIFVISGLLVVGVIMALWNLLNAIFASKINDYRLEHGKPLHTEKVETQSFFSKMYDKAWALVPMSKEADIDLGHDYDGIRELDNTLPPWWLYGFYLTILIGAGYLYVYHFSDIGMSQQEEYEMAMIEGERRKAEYQARQGNSLDEKNLVALEDSKSLSTGEKIFIANCAACHGNAGQGGVGPNLTDDYWVHGGSVPDIYKTIKYGVPEKGMIAWKAQMQPTTMHQLASYIKTLRGTNPPNAKAKEGDLYKEPGE